MSRQVSSAYLDMIATNQQSLLGELYTITLKDGTSDYFTDLDVDITFNGNTYKSGSLRISGLHMKLAVGLSIDEQDIKISAMPGDTLAGGFFIEGCSQGLLDGASITRDRAVWATNGTAPYFVYTQTAPITVFRMFYGLVSEISKIGRTVVELKVKSPLKLLDLNLPRRTYQAPCSWTLFDAGCALHKSDWQVAGFVGDTISPVQWLGGVPTVSGADGEHYFAQGRLLFTSGGLAGEQFYIGDNDDNFLYVLGITVPPSPGDSFLAWPGCAKTIKACQSKFSNLPNFRGFPFVPPTILSA
jgi:uncharacterized phage protein (TIGR02218 family)